MSEPVLDWAAEVPDGWQVLPLKRVAEIANSNVDKKSYDGGIPVRLCNYTDVYYNEYITPEMSFMDATATASEVRRFRLRPGDVIITKDSESWDDIAIPGCVREDIADLVCGYHLTVLRPRAQSLDGRFLLRTLQASGVREQFWVSANGVTRFGLGLDGIGMTRVPRPPLAQQRAIADFLDRKTAAIDALIEKKERLITLLEEKRQALITQAVTKGLDPNVPMKDSGIEWLGEIPAHWTVMHVKHAMARTVDCPHSTPEYDADGAFPAIRTADVDRGRLLLDGARRVRPEVYLERVARMVPRVGDILYSREGERFGMAALVPPDTTLCLAQRMMIFRPQPTQDSQYLMWLLNSEAVYQQVKQETVGATSPRINIPTISNAWIPCPPLGEQQAIASSLWSGLARIDKTVSAVAKHIQLLREYRQAVITAAVTGKLDVTSKEAA